MLAETQPMAAAPELLLAEPGHAAGSGACSTRGWDGPWPPCG